MLVKRDTVAWDGFHVSDCTILGNFNVYHILTLNLDGIVPALDGVEVVGIGHIELAVAQLVCFNKIVEEVFVFLTAEGGLPGEGRITGLMPVGRERVPCPGVFAHFHPIGHTAEDEVTAHCAGCVETLEAIATHLVGRIGEVGECLVVHFAPSLVCRSNHKVRTVLAGKVADAVEPFVP